MGMAVLSFAVSFLLYSISLSVEHDSRTDIEWAERFQPIVELVSSFVPSLRRMPMSLIARGEGEWAQAVQNVLFLGWLFSPMLAGWIALDVLVINRHHWGRKALLITGWGWGILILISAAIIAAMLPSLFCGLTLGFAPRKIGASSGLPVLAVLFLVMLYAFFTLAASCNALLKRSGIGGQAIPPDPRDSDMLHDFLHDAFAGRIIERIFVARRDRVE
jgi:MFS family permease